MEAIQGYFETAREFLTKVVAQVASDSCRYCSHYEQVGRQLWFAQRFGDFSECQACCSILAQRALGVL